MDGLDFMSEVWVTQQCVFDWQSAELAATPSSLFLSAATTRLRLPQQCVEYVKVTSSFLGLTAPLYYTNKDTSPCLLNVIKHRQRDRETDSLLCWRSHWLWILNRNNFFSPSGASPCQCSMRRDTKYSKNCKPAIVKFDSIISELLGERKEIQMEKESRWCFVSNRQKGCLSLKRQIQPDLFGQLWKQCCQIINEENRISGRTLPSSGHYGQ